MLSVVIVNYKNEDLTIRYVKEELVKVHNPHIVVIVNNGATDASDKELCNGLNAGLVYDINDEIDNNLKVFVIHNNENSGFAIGNNLGAKFSSIHFPVEYFLFSNNDIKLNGDNVIEHLIHKLRSLPDVSIIGPKVIGLDGSLQSPEPYQSFFKRMIIPYFNFLLTDGFKKNYYQSDYSEKAKEGYHYKVMGSFFIVDKNDFFNCGMMDENTFLYYEENILSERIQRIGKNVYYYPLVSVIHAHSQTIGKYSSFRKQRDYMFSSAAYYYKKYKGTSTFQIAIGYILKELSIIIGAFKRKFVHKY